MQVTKDSYILSRNVIRVNNKTNKFYNFIKRNRFIIVASSVFWGGFCHLDKQYGL